MVHAMSQIKNISEVTEPLKEQILKGDVHTIDEMRAWLKPLGYSDTINEAAINFILREFVMSKISSESMMNMDIFDWFTRSIYKGCLKINRVLI